MGWKGTVRSLNAASNRAIRESDRREKQRAKIEHMQESANSVEEMEDFLKSLISIHCECSDDIDWEEVSNNPEPEKPKRSNKFEGKARDKHENFKPNFFHKILKIEKWREKNLETNIGKAIKKDDHQHDLKIQKYNIDHAQWKEENNLAKRILKNELEAFEEVMNRFSSIGDNRYISGCVSLNKSDKWFVAEMNVLSSDIVPQEKYSLRQSGSLSVKKMPKREFHDIYQNYVCSCSLRVAREIFALLPIDEIVVNVTDDLLNKSTGYQENQAILSVLFVRDTLDQLNVKRVAPSSAMSNFIHNMKFKSVSGFEVVESVSDKSDE